MIVYFDRYFHNSYAASSLLLRKRIKNEEKFHKGDYLVFSTTLSYKKTSISEVSKNRRNITHYILPFRNMLFLYIGFYLFYFKNRSKITEIVSQSSPFYNLIFFAFSPFRKKVRYIIQDINPDGILKTLSIPRVIIFVKPILMIAYRRIPKLETISFDMFDYLQKEYKIKPAINYNPNVYEFDIKLKKINRDEIIIGYSGNFSNSHGIKYPLELLKQLTKHANIKIKINGFGKYFDFAKSKFQNNMSVEFGSSLPEIEYLEFLNTLDIVLLFQEFGYEKFCLSCKFNTLINLKKPLIYVGPNCDISRYIEKTEIGIIITNFDTPEVIKTKTDSFIRSLESYSEKAKKNDHFDLNEFFS